MYKLAGPGAGAASLAVEMLHDHREVVWGRWPAPQQWGVAAPAPSTGDQDLPGGGQSSVWPGGRPWPAAGPALHPPEVAGVGGRDTGHRTLWVVTNFPSSVWNKLLSISLHYYLLSGLLSSLIIIHFWLTKLTYHYSLLAHLSLFTSGSLSSLIIIHFWLTKLTYHYSLLAH